MSETNRTPSPKPLSVRKRDAAQEIAAKIDALATEVTPNQDKLIQAYVRAKARKSAVRT